MSISRKPGVNQKSVSIFNPSANYIWDEDQEFVILGSEFNTIMKSLQSAANNPEFKRNVAIYQGLSAVNNIFKDAVEQNLIFEAGKENLSSVPETKQSTKPE